MMNRRILLDLLTNILSSQDYDVNPLPGAGPRTDLVVAKGEWVTCIQYGEAESDLRYFADAVEGAGGTYDSLFISGEITDPMARFADRCGIRIWDRSELEIRIGRAMLAEAEDASYDLLGLSPGYRKSREYEPRGYQEHQVYSEHSAGRMPEIPEIVDDSCDALQLRCAAIRVEEKRAIATAKGFVSGITGAVIEFVPFWNYRYAIDTYRQHKAKAIHISAEGAGAINALNRGRREHLQDVCDSISVPCQNYEIRTPTVTKVEAREEILNDAIESSTKNISSTSTSGGAIITEHRTVRPRVGDIDLEMELVYLPVWDVKGRGGSIMVDAHDGSAMTAPIDDDVEFL